MTPVQVQTLYEIRRLLKEAYEDYFLRFNDGHKSSEGFIEVTYPNIFADTDYVSCEADGVGVYSYVLGPSRMHYWRKGTDPACDDYACKTCSDPFEQALKDVREWHREQMAAEV